MPPITLNAISNATVKVRWKEPYASEGLNRKLAVVIPAGVYRGLNLGVSASNLSVDLVADAAGDHVAVQESSDGFSTTYTDDTSGTITLPLTGFTTNDVVVICLVINYTVGATTTAEFRGYVLADYNALTAADKSALVVLGTVLRPAAGIIPAANITHDRRTLPFLRRTDESTPWNPLIRNGGFELGQTNGTYRHSSPFWKTSSSNANFTIRPVATEANSGAKSLEMTNSVAGVVSATIQQELWMPVAPGRFLMGRLYKKSIQAATTSPSGRIRFLFGDLDGTNDVQEDLLFDISAVDGSFQEFSGIVKVPATARILKAVQLILAGTYAGTGPCIRIDDVQAWAQVDGANWLDSTDTRVAEVATAELFIGSQNSFDSAGAKLSFDGTSVVVDRKDLVYGPGSLPPPVDCVRAILGTRALSSAADARIARVSAKYSGTFDVTLMWESAKDVAGIAAREYVNSSGHKIRTVNASFDGTNWVADVNTTDASRQIQTENGWRFERKDVTTSAWAEAAWDRSLEIAGQVNTATPVGSSLLIPRSGVGVDNGVFIGPDGRITKAFRQKRYDAVNFDTANTEGFWGGTNISGGQVYLGNNDGEAILKFESGALSNQRASAIMRGGSGITSGRSAFPVTTRPGFSAKFRLSTVTTNRRDFLGFTDGGGYYNGNSPMCIVLFDTALSATMVIRYEDTTNTEFSYNTGFTPLADTWYYVTLIVLGQAPGSFLFRIGTTPDWKSTDTIAHQTALSGNGNLQPDDSGFNWRFGAGVTTLNAAIKTMELSWVEVFATKEWV